MRSKVSLAVAVLLSVTALPLCAAGIDGKPADLESIQALEARAKAAEPREQCFLYAELVHQMTELSVREYAAGDVARAMDMLKDIQQLAQKIPRAIAANNKHMKDAEILLRHTAFRLNEMLHGTRYEDRPLVEATLTDVSQAQREAMLQVFKK
ncbi:MAG TPA: hypothetical protein VMW15_12045 [Terracidiphilus sp.]|nr:hypothetical protein [Terracidiphilus sp.]